jgi:hypothetical protein
MSVINKYIMLGAAGAGGDDYYINVISDSAGSFGATLNGGPFVDSSDNMYSAGSSNGSYYLDTDVQGTLNSTKTVSETYVANPQLTLYASGIDSSGNVYLAGDVSSGTNPSNPLVTKINSSGTAQWAKSVNNNANSRVYDIAVGSSYVLATGIAVPSSSVAGATWLYDLSGNLQWKTASLSFSSLYNWACAINESVGKCYLGGMVDSPAVPIMYSLDLATGSSTVLGKWRTAYAGRFEGVACDSSDNVIGVGYVQTGSTYNAIIVKFNSTIGSVTWSKEITLGTGFCGLFGVTTDSSDNIYVGGVSNGGDHTFIGKYNSSGTFQWGVQIADVGLNNRTNLYGLDLDSEENIIARGFTSAVSGSNSNYDTAILRYPNDGSITGTFGDFVISSLTPGTGGLSSNISTLNPTTLSWSTTTTNWTIGTSNRSTVTNSITAL